MCRTMRSLVDWEMRSDRNTKQSRNMGITSLVDWEMRSDRNLMKLDVMLDAESSRLGNTL